MKFRCLSMGSGLGQGSTTHALSMAIRCLASKGSIENEVL